MPRLASFNGKKERMISYKQKPRKPHLKEL
jgi:hypothetical protein